MFLRRDLGCTNGEFQHHYRIKHRTTDRGLKEAAFNRAAGRGKCYECRHLRYYRDGRLAKPLDADTAVCEVDRHIIHQTERPHDPGL